LLFLILATSAKADVVYYKNGTKLEGKIVKATKDSVTIRGIVDGAQCQVEVPQELIERTEKGPLPKAAPIPKAAVKKQSISKPKGVSGSIVKPSAPDVKKEIVAKKDDVKNEQQVKEARKWEQDGPTKQKMTKRENSAKEIIQEESDKDEVLLQEDKKEVKPEQKIYSEQKSNETCQYSLLNRKDKTLDLNNKVKMYRIELSVAVANGTTFVQLQNLFAYLLQQELSKNIKLDALWVIAYRKTNNKESIPIAYGVWAPPGGWDDFPHMQDKDKYQWQYRLIKQR